MNMLKSVAIIGGAFSAVAIGCVAYESYKIDKETKKMQAETDRIINETNRTIDDYIRIQEEIQEQLDRVSENWTELNNIFASVQ